MLFGSNFTFANFITDVFWLLIIIASDLFRRHDVSGFGKVLRIILLIVLPYIGIFAYLFAQGRGMAERKQARTTVARKEVRPWLALVWLTRSRSFIG